MKRVEQKDLKPGSWYWWIFPNESGGDPRRYHKVCVVRCFEEDEETGRVVAINVGEDLEEDDSYYIGALGGKFYGPVEAPVTI